MTHEKSEKDVELVLNEEDMSTKRIYGRRLLLQGLGGALLSTGILAATTTKSLAKDSDTRQMGDGKNSFADSKFRDSKADNSDKKPNADY